MTSTLLEDRTPAAAELAAETDNSATLDSATLDGAVLDGPQRSRATWVAPASSPLPAAATAGERARQVAVGIGRAILLLPRNVCIGILVIYRAVISPLYGDVCRYYPSCSRYALESIQQHGVVKGVWLGSKRLARCHPWAEGGVDDVPPCEHHHVETVRLGFVRRIERIGHDHGAERITAEAEG